MCVNTHHLHYSSCVSGSVSVPAGICCARRSRFANAAHLACLTSTRSADWAARSTRCRTCQAKHAPNCKLSTHIYIHNHTHTRSHKHTCLAREHVRHRKTLASPSYVELWRTIIGRPGGTTRVHTTIYNHTCTKIIKHICIKLCKYIVSCGSACCTVTSVP